MFLPGRAINDSLVQSDEKEYMKMKKEYNETNNSSRWTMDNQRQKHLRKETGGVVCTAVTSNDTAPMLVKVRVIGECVVCCTASDEDT